MVDLCENITAVVLGGLTNQHYNCNSPVVESLFGDINMRLKFFVGSVFGGTSGVECSFPIWMGWVFIDVNRQNI